MRDYKVSVIIPTYNYAQFISRAIQSVLDQTFSDCELIVVDDGSTDGTAEVISNYLGPKVKYIYQDNRGLPAARNTGMSVAQGQIFAFLDADDRFHPQKLEVQVAFLEKHPEIGLTYNSRFLVDPNGNCLQYQRAPTKVNLNNLISGYPFTPSDVVIRRQWAYQVGLFDESFILNSEDLNFHIRLALAGCQFAGVERVLSFRQIHAGRIFRNIAGKMATYLRALDTAFTHPECPPGALALRDTAYANHYLIWGLQAFFQGDYVLGQEYFLTAIKLNPQLLANQANKLLQIIVWESTRDGGDHIQPLTRFFQHLPAEYPQLNSYCDWAIGRGFLIRGSRDLLWGRNDHVDAYFAKAINLGATLDKSLLQTLSDQLSGIASFYGTTRAQHSLKVLSPYLRKVGSREQVRWLNGLFSINQAFDDYSKGEYGRVPGSVMRAIINDPAHLADRGVLTILARSLIDIKRQGA